ncbi:MAG: hypothetical protein WBG86_08260 [Polyangiales bacterium]
MIRFVLPVLLLLAFATFGCDGTTKLQRNMLEDSTWETSGGEDTPWEHERKKDDEWEKQTTPSSDASQDPFMAPRRTTGVIERQELDSVLAKGLGDYLQNVETEPAFDKGRFVGFRIVKLFPGDLTYASLDLRPGDVVTRINGKPISRPEHASEVWEDLQTASDLIVEYRRGDEEKTMKFAIVDVG